MKKYYVLILSLFISCVEDQFAPVGDELIEEEIPQFYKIDTLTVIYSTLKFDSIPTNQTERLLVGKYSDSWLGQIQSDAYFEVGFDRELFINQDAQFDSANLVLYFDYAYYDTLKPHTISVHRLLQNMQRYDDGYLYNSTRFEYDSVSLGTTTYFAKPNQQDSITIPLSNEFGLDLFTKIQDNELTSSLNDFIDYLKGFVLVSNQGAPLIGFSSDQSGIRLYYEDREEIAVKRVQKFPVNAGNIQFNAIYNNKPSNLASTIFTINNPIPSDSLEEKAFIQAGIGLVTLVDFPWIRNLLLLTKNYYLPKAVLSISVEKNSYQSNQALSNNLTFYLSNADGDFLSEIALPHELTIDNEFNLNTRYEIDVTEFLNFILQEDGDSDYALMIAFPDASFNSTVDRINFNTASKESILSVQYLPIN